MTRRSRIWLAAFLFLLVWAPVATADPIGPSDPLEITSGFVGLNVSFGIDLGLFSDEFSLLGEGSGGLGPFNDAVCATCTPAQTKPEVRVTFTPSDLVFDARATGCPECAFAGNLLFQAAPTILSPTGNTNTFTMSGTLTAFRPGSDDPLFSTRVFGSGQLITAQQDLVFRFFKVDPVPEPATLVLFGSGLVGSLVRARRRARVTDED